MCSWLKEEDVGREEAGKGRSRGRWEREMWLLEGEMTCKKKEKSKLRKRENTKEDREE